MIYEMSLAHDEANADAARSGLRALAESAYRAIVAISDDERPTVPCFKARLVVETA